MTMIAPEQLESISIANIEKYHIWPVKQQHLLAVHFLLLEELCTYIRKISVENIDIPILINFHLSSEIIRLIKSSILAREIKKSGQLVSLDRTFNTANSLSLNEPPVLEGLPIYLKRGFSLSSFRKVIHLIKDVITSSNDNIGKCLFQSDFENNFITFIKTDMVNHYAQEANTRILFYRHQYLFADIGGIDKNAFCNSETFKALLGIGNKYIENYCINDHVEISKTYLQNWLSNSWNYISHYMMMLENRIKVLPKSVGVGTAGNMWYRMLARFMIKKGVNVFRFDHGAGRSQYNDELQQANFDFEDCTKFITYTKSHAIEYGLIYKSKTTVSETCPELLFLKENKLFAKRAQVSTFNESHQQKTNSTPKVLIIVPLFGGATYHACAKEDLSDLCILHMIGKITEFIESKNFSVALKPHPVEGAHRYNSGKHLTSLTTAEIIQENFEKIYKRYDILVLLQPTTTIFSTIMLSGKYLIYIDLGYSEFSLHANNLLKKSCNIVSAQKDEQGLVSINWDELSNALENYRSSHTNAVFGDHYFLNKNN